MEPIILQDNHIISQDCTVLTQEQLHIPGLNMFGRRAIKSAISPLVMHYHPDCFEITFVMKGTTTFSADNKEFHLKGGDIFITLPDEIHSTNQNPVSICELIWFKIDVSNPDSILFLDSTSSEKLLESLKSLDTRIFRMTAVMETLIQETFHHLGRQQPPQLTASYLVLILQLLVNGSAESASSLSADILLSVDYIADHLTEQIELDNLAELCHLSVSSYKQKFKQQMGITPRNYINMQKIEYAKYLLNSGCTITDTAMTLGFNTSNYFTTVFKKYTFQSPTEYLKHIQV